MDCKYCGKPNPDGTRFCAHCGKATDEQKAATYEWEYAARVTPLQHKAFLGIDAGQLWTLEKGQTETAWDQVVKLGQYGWELVSIAPITDVPLLGHEAGITTQLLWVFKRPKRR
jgi:hypothetical protein